MDLEPCILDLDGTLMPTHEIDNRCYWLAIDDLFSTGSEPLDLHGFRRVTDDGILDEWSERALGRSLIPEERRAVRQRFLERLEQAATEEPEAFRPFPGVFDWLEARSSGSVAIATGGWRHTAAFKLVAAGLDRFALPLAGSDDAPTRTGIMLTARDHLEAGMQQATPTYLGDGTWDLEATQQLNWQFIGIASGERAQDLLRAGAGRVVENFLPLLP
jgi:phosphoglycolate phosphatase-like HAD superfamily hydrolase